MGTEQASEYAEIEARIVGSYNLLYENDLSVEDIEFYALEDERYEGEIYLPHIGLNVDLWDEWSTEKRVEVLIHEFAHTEKYEDDHHPDFWSRVVELTEIAIDHESEFEALFDDELDPETLKQTVVESIHEYVIETEMDTVDARKHAVSDALDVPDDAACSD